MPILQSVASNVESALAFSLSVKVVDIVGQLRGSAASGSNQSSRDARDSMLVFCTGILLLSIGSTFLTSGESVPSRFRMAASNKARAAARQQHAAIAQAEHEYGRTPLWWQRMWAKGTMLLSSSPLPPAITRGLKDISNHVMVLSLSRLAMQQVRLSKFSVDPNIPFHVATFQYTQRIIEITFIGVLVSSCLTTLLPALQAMVENRMAGTGSTAAAPTNSLVGKQLNSLIVNMQRTFADTVASVFPDVQTRKMVVLLGLCILPSISGAVTGQGGSSAQQLLSATRVQEFFMMFRGASRRRRTVNGVNGPAASSWKETSSMLSKIWIAGLSMAWINTALSFIISNQPGGILQTWISVISTVCLAVLTRALHPMFPGLDVFQGYIEWSVATSALSYIGLAVRRGAYNNSTETAKFVVLGCTGAAFYAVDVLLKDTKRQEGLSELKRHARAPLRWHPAAPRLSATLETLQSVTIIMFTNSLVSYCMDMISPSLPVGNPNAARSLNSIGPEIATVVVGLIVTKTLVQIISSSVSQA